MSDQNNNNDTQPLGTEPVQSKPSRDTASVPLRKETVRVTLKSTPAGVKKAAPPRPPAPSAPTPMSKETAPQANTPPPVRNTDIPDVTSAVPLKQETMRVTLKANAPAAAPAPAPAAPSAAPAPAAPKPAAPAAAAPAPAATGQPTVALATHSLPKATVQLQQTQPLAQPGVASPEGVATFNTAVEESEPSDNSTLLTVLSIVAFVFALILLFTQLQRAGIWIDASNGSYGDIFSAAE